MCSHAYNLHKELRNRVKKKLNKRHSSILLPWVKGSQEFVSGENSNLARGTALYSLNLAREEENRRAKQGRKA